MVDSKENLLKLLKSSLTSSSYDHFIKILENSQIQDSDDVKDFFLWASHTKNLKVVSQDVPSDIIKGNSKLHDIKVECKGPDDRVYDSSPDIRAKIARGNTILELNENGVSTFKLIIYALRKFTGGLGDEDDIDRKSGEWKKYFLKDYKHVRRVLSLKKANGEAAHLSCVYVNNEFIICVGSKNVHLMFKSKDDLLNYTEQRFTVARVIGLAVWRHLDKMENYKKHQFLSFLSQFNLTVVFEILNPETQHVEDLSYLKEPLLKFITFTRNVVEESPQSLCSMTPDCAIEIARLFELSCVDIEDVNNDQIEEHLLKIRQDHGYEGVVLYFLDSDNNVIGLLKKKTTWYIIVRAIREKLRYHISPKCTESIQDLEKRIKKRLEEIKNWIGFDDEDLKSWLNLSIEFVRWFDQEYKKNTITRQDYSDKFPVLWTRFLTESDSDDKIKIKIKGQSNVRELQNDLENLKLNS